MSKHYVVHLKLIYCMSTVLGLKNKEKGFISFKIKKKLSLKCIISLSLSWLAKFTAAK